MASQKTEAAKRAGERAVLDYMGRSGYEPVTQKRLLHLMHVSPQERQPVRDLIRRLREQGRIVRGRGGRLALAGDPGAGDSAAEPSPRSVHGTLRRHPDGYAFVIPESGGDDVFLPPREVRGALSGDRVAVRITGGGPGRLEGVLVRTLSRRSRRVLGVFLERGPLGLVRPFEKSLSEGIRVPAAFRMGARDRDVVEVEIVRDPAAGRSAEGKVLEVLGPMAESGMDFEVVVRTFGLETEFPRDVLRAADELPSRISPREAAKRKRFDDPPPVTIDGETARDFDDAIAVKELRDGGFRLWVHIADVSRFVEPGGALDREARRRGTSVYFPGRVLPMFPERLSNDLCSLRPRVDRLVQSAILDVGADGALRGARFADGVIHSAARLTYTQVARVLDGEKRVPGVPRRVVPMLESAGRLRAALESRRHARGGLDIDLPEPQILLDVEGVMTGVTIEPRNEAHRLIEEAMILANKAVALELERLKRDCAFRIHEPPDPTKLETLVAFVAGLGLELRQERDGSIEPRSLARLFDELEGKPEQRLLGQVTLRSMKQARYSPVNRGHFGLALESYCHFTSPIRRYPDLMVHRLLRAARNGGPAAHDLDEIETLSIQSSELERNAEAAERELLLWKKVAFIADKVGRRFAGLVSAVTAFGLFVQLEEGLVEGLVHVEKLGAERFRFDPARMALTGERTGLEYRLGDRLRVRVDRVDRVLRRVDLSLADERLGAGGPEPIRSRAPLRRRRGTRRAARPGARERRRR